MGRSPSPGRRRDRDRERDRDRDERRRRHRSKERERERDRSRSRDKRRRSPDRRRRSLSGDRGAGPGAAGSSSAATGPSSSAGKRGQMQERPAITQADLEGKTPEEQEMIRIMGFGGFDSTKGKKVDNNDVGEVQVVLKRKYRQYMNRKGGFNRPLDFVA